MANASANLTIIWKKEPDDHDYPAAAAYLSLIAKDQAVAEIVAGLRNAPLISGKAKDLLRASELPVLPADNSHVRSDLQKVATGHRLSPVLLVRGDLRKGYPLTIADGYHRVCASYHLDENTDIPARIFDLP